MAMGSLLQALLAAASLAGLCYAEDAPDFGFGADVAKHFVMPPAPDHVHEIAADNEQPVMVLLMNKASPICKTLKKAIKNGSKVKALLDSFTVAYAEESIDKWTQDKYVPQVIFYHGGERLEVESGHKSGKYLYADETKLEAAMVKALSLSKGKGGGASKGAASKNSEGSAGAKKGCSGSAECDDIDDKDMCEFTDSCTWNSGRSDGSDSPCQGGAVCNDIDEKDMCEFTDGCNWTGEEDDASADNGAAGGAEHGFGKELADKIMVNVAPSAVSAAAKKAQKPYMVLLTQDWCGPCKELMTQINAGTAVKELLDSFVTTHATGDNIHQWQAEGQNYVPQAIFYTAEGKLLEVTPANEKFKYFFDSEYQLLSAMQEALKKAQKESGEL